MTQIADALKKKSKKKKIKTEKVWTQKQLKKLWENAWGVAKVILRQPVNEISVFDSVEYLGTRRVKYNKYGGAYDAHHWRVHWLTKLSVLDDFPKEGALEIPCTKWNKNKEKGNIQKEPEEVIGIHTLTVDGDGRDFRLEEGNKLE